MEQAEITWRTEVQRQYIARLEEIISEVKEHNATAPRKKQRPLARWQQFLRQAQADLGPLERAVPSQQPLADVATLTLTQCKEIVGGLSKPSKMPGTSYSLPAWACQMGSIYRDITGTACSGCYARKGGYCWPNRERDHIGAAGPHLRPDLGHW